VILGYGEELPTLKARLGVLPDPRWVHLLGARRDVPRLYAAFDVFALSSRTEGLPLVILEAMASGVPVVSTAVGGVPGVITDGATGLLCPPEDVAALGARLERLRAEPHLAEALRARALERVHAEYSLDSMVVRYLALYERLSRRISRAPST
jgi:glycosyltransferase involved in cell wall biosynthesis